MQTQTANDSTTIPQPLARPTSYEQQKSELIKMVSSIPRLPPIISSSWVTSIVQRSKNCEDVFSRLRLAKEFSEQYGEHYHHATYCSFETKSAKQGQALSKVKQFSERLHDREQVSNNLMLFGPSGTGKDHLLYCLIMEAIFKHGYEVSWHNGNDLFGQLKNSVNLGTVEQWVTELQEAEILAISDPLPIDGDLSPFLLTHWFRIIDYRYRHKLPVWLTINVIDKEDFKQRFSTPTASRLRENAYSVHFNWENYRDK